MSSLMIENRDLHTSPVLDKDRDQPGLNEDKDTQSQPSSHVNPVLPSPEDARYALGIVERICTQAGPGLPGSPQERERAAMIKLELESHLGAANVELEEFQLAPGAFLDSQLIATLFLLIAVLMNISTGRLAGVPTWVTSTAGFLFSLSSVMLFVFEFIFVVEVLDPFFKKKESINVIGKLRNSDSQKVKRLLILSGHHDSAVEFTWLRLAGYGFFVLTAVWMIGMIVVLVMNSIQLAGVIIGNSGLARLGMLRWYLVAGLVVPSIIYAVFFTREKKNGGIVPGAADNLSGCALVVAMCRFLVQNPSVIPDHTEIRFITFGSEEAGVRGSRRYVQRHLDELKRLDVRLINFETIVNPEIAILASESNGTVKNSPGMVRSVVAAAQRAGVPFKVQSASLGTSSDAGPFSRSGLKAVTLVGFTAQQMVAFYHQERDAPQILTIEPLLNVMRLTYEWVRCGGE